MARNIEELYIYIYILASYKKAFVLLSFLCHKNLNKTCLMTGLI